MTRNRKLIVTGLFVCFVAATAMAQPPDVKGSKDHPLISRYPGSYINQYAQKEYDELTLPLGPAKGEGFVKSQHLEGKWTRILYVAPQGRSILEVFRNYESALQHAGFQSLFTCANTECGVMGGAQVRLNPGVSDYWTDNPRIWPQRYLSARLSRPEGDVYVSLHVVLDPPRTVLHIIEMKPMEAGLVTVNAEALAGDISRTGHASVYGIYFDTGKADVKPESDPALTEIAKLLEQDAKLKLHVVGHTDNVGSLASNMDLSKRRADAVVKVLTGKHGVAAARLDPQGVGPLAPVASNAAEEGRAKNRRVELVAQ